MRAEAAIRGIPSTTTLNGLEAAVKGLETFRETGEWKSAVFRNIIGMPRV